MNDKVKKTPELRFVGFKDKWVNSMINELADRYDNLRIPITASDRVAGSTPYYGANGIQDYVDGFTHDGEYILVAEDGASDLRNYPVQYINGKVWVNNHAHVLQAKSEVADNRFLMNALKHKNIEPYLVGGGRSKLNADVMMKISFKVPELVEQKQIGLFFSNLDNLINFHQNKLELIKEMKKSLLQKMFPKDGTNFPEIRFAGFEEDWKHWKLGDISEKVTEKNKNSKYSETLTNSAEFGIINQRDFFDKDISNEKNLSGYYVVRSDDFVYNPRISNYAPVGPIKRNNLGRTGVMSPLYYVFRTHNVNKTYLEKYFSSNNWHIFMRMNGDSGARSDRFAIKDSLFREMPIPVPSNKEQIIIGNFFDQIDNLITHQQRELNWLKNMKRSLLQGMFI